jgi:P-type Ca2+ transporter type 2C
VQGLVVLAAVAGSFAWALGRGYGDEEARTLSFTTLIVANLGLIFANRSWSETIVSRLRSPNRALWWVTLGAGAFLACALYVPILRSVFRFAVLHAPDVTWCVAAGVASVLWFDVFKLLNRPRAGTARG